MSDFEAQDASVQVDPDAVLIGIPDKLAERILLAVATDTALLLVPHEWDDRRILSVFVDVATAVATGAPESSGDKVRIVKLGAENLQTGERT